MRNYFTDALLVIGLILLISGGMIALFTDYNTLGLIMNISGFGLALGIVFISRRIKRNEIDEAKND